MLKECQCRLRALEHESIVSAFSLFCEPICKHHRSEVGYLQARVLDVSQRSSEYCLSHIVLSQEPVLVFGGVSSRTAALHDAGAAVPSV